MVFSVPRVLSFEQETDQGGIEVEEFPIVMVASGELLEQVVHPHNPNKTIFHFAQATPTTVQHIAFAYGPFSILDLSPSASQVTGDLGVDEDIEAEALALEAEGQLQMHAFCLPGREDELQNSVGFMTRALEFFLEEFGSYPFNSFKLVFVDDSPVTMFNSAAMGLFSTDLLHSRNVIDQAYETRQTLSYSLAAQWVGINIIQKTWADTWLIQGLSLYVNSLWLRRMMGNNEYRFRLKKDVTRCCAWDIKMPPLCQPGILHPPSADVLPFINLKAPLVLHTLDRQLLKAGTHNGLSRVIPKLYLSAISGDLKENLLSTHNFLRICKKVSGGGSDLKNFQDQWIYSNGCPKLHIAATFNRKRMAVELAIKQESPAWAYHTQADWLDKVDLRPVHIFEGQMAVRIHEADGTPYEHVIDIREGYKKHEVGFNTKYKRIRRSTKRFQARKAAEEAAAAGDQEAIEAVGNIDTSFSLPLWEDARNPNTERERDLWRVAEWTEEDEKAQEQAVYEWIRIDTEFEWLAVINFEQPDFMWLSQLQRDRDVVAQLEVSCDTCQSAESMLTCCFRLYTPSLACRQQSYRVIWPRQLLSQITSTEYGWKLLLLSSHPPTNPSTTSASSTFSRSSKEATASSQSTKLPILSPSDVFLALMTLRI
jgi:transcription initiation factor TFIID subunit 2